MEGLRKCVKPCSPHEGSFRVPFRNHSAMSTTIRREAIGPALGQLRWFDTQEAHIRSDGRVNLLAFIVHTTNPIISRERRREGHSRPTDELRSLQYEEKTTQTVVTLPLILSLAIPHA
jgi:hypothetical protein